MLEAAHRTVVLDGRQIGCGVALDRCRQPREKDAHRWDYVFTHRDTDQAYAIEVHHAAADQVKSVISKKRWAEQLLAARCPELQFESWVWIASPPEGAILFPRLHPAARLLADAGIGYPVKQYVLP